jgi:penicillin-binding protein 2
MIEVVNGSNGTGHEAELDGVEVAGKTGTAQWGPKNKERTAAWFAGFLPAEEPKYAFAAVYEGDVGSKVHGGTTAAPMIGGIFQEIYKGSAANKRGLRESTQQVRRAQPVEEDASD